MKLLFDRMHYGVDNNVAALSVMMLASLVSVAAAIGLGKLLAHWYRGESA